MPDSTLRYYEVNARGTSERYETANLTEIHELISSTFRKACSILEIGGGSGRDAAFVLDNGHELAFSDASFQMLKEAIRIHGALAGRALVYRLPQPLPFADGTFDGILAIAVLMHLPIADIGPAINEISRVLKPEGRCLISTPRERDDVSNESRDSHDRLMTSVNLSKIIGLQFSEKFEILRELDNADGLDRGGIIWHTCVLRRLS